MKELRICCLLSDFFFLFSFLTLLLSYFVPLFFSYFLPSFLSYLIIYFVFLPVIHLPLSFSLDCSFFLSFLPSFPSYPLPFFSFSFFATPSFLYLFVSILPPVCAFCLSFLHCPSLLFFFLSFYFPSLFSPSFNIAVFLFFLSFSSALLIPSFIPLCFL